MCIYTARGFNFSSHRTGWPLRPTVLFLYRDVLKLSTPFRGYLYCAYIATVPRCAEVKYPFRGYLYCAYIATVGM
jgi:hypothetical protein